MKQLHDVFPRHTIEGLGDVKFEQERWSFASVQSSDSVPHIQKTVMDALFPLERRLGRADNLVNDCSKAHR